MSSASGVTAPHDLGDTGALSVAVSPDGSRVVSGGRDGIVWVWDLATGDPIGGPFRGHTAAVASVVVSPDGSRVVSGSLDGTVQVWDLATGQPIGAPLTGRTDVVWSVAVSPDGSRIVVGGDDGTVRVWDMATGALIGGPLTGHTDSIVSVAVSPDGTRIVSGGGHGDGTVRVWDLATGNPIGEPFRGHRDGVWSVAVSPDGTRIVSCGDDGDGADGVVRVWNLATGDPIGEPLRGHSGGAGSVAVSPDGSRIVGGGRAGMVGVWDLATGDPIGEPLRGHTGRVDSVVVTPDGTRIVSGGDGDGFVGAGGMVRVWDLATGDPVAMPLRGHIDTVGSVVVSPDGTRIVSGSGDRTVRVWDLATGDPVGEPLEGRTGSVRSVAVSPDGTRIVSGDDGAMWVWDLATGDPVGEPLTRFPNSVASVAMFPDGTRIVSGSVDGAVQVWDLATGDPVGEPLAGHTGSVWSVAVSPDGTRIVSGSYDSTVRVWDLNTGAPIGEPLTGHAGGVWSVAVSPDGTRILSGGFDGMVRVWDLATGDPIGRPLTGHAGRVWSVAVSPDGSRVVSGSDDGTVRVWDLATGAPIGEPLRGHAGGVRSVAVSPDGTRIVSGGVDRTVRVWRPFGPPRVDLGAGVVTDAATTADRLNLALDVQILSALLAATSTAPPLSIALMGRWGSGKSSLMEQLIAAVARLIAQDEPRDAYVRQVRQVRFNAWHYSDDHLWVGLIEQLFRELRAKPAPPDASTESVPELRAKLGRAKTRQARLDRQLSELDELDPSRGWFGQLGVIRRAVAAAQATGQDAGEEMRQRRFWVGLLFAVPAVLGVAATVLFGEYLRDWALTLPGVRDIPTTLPWLVAAVGLAPALVGAVRTLWSTARTSGDDLHARLQKSRADNAKELDRLEDKLTRLDPAQQLDALLAEISAEDRYATHRGLLGRVSADLHRLNDQLATQADPAQRWRIILYIDDLDRCPADRVVEVLQAVNLLMSMELFFVVVAVDPRWLFAALDQHHRHLLTDTVALDDTGAAARALSGRALDYLDKIFQVPFALRPVGGHGSAFLRGLLPEPDPDPDPASESVSQPAAAPTGQPPYPQDPSTTPVADRERRLTPPQSPSPPAGGVQIGDASTRPPEPRRPTAAGSELSAPRVEPTPLVRPPAPVSWVVQNLRLSRAETEFLPQLAGLLPTPRAMKKFTNLYRLLRLSIPPAAVPAFCGDRTTGDGPYQAAALLLAILVSDPGNVDDLFTRVTALDVGLETTEDVIAALSGEHSGNLPEENRAHTDPATHRLITTITDLRAHDVPVHGQVASYQHWARAVARFSFETYHLYTEPDLPSP